MLAIDRLDHLVLTVRDLDATLGFYRDVLGLEPVEYAPEHWALRFGGQKINLHVAGRERSPRARHAVPGTADFCLVAGASMDRVLGRLAACGVPIEEGPVARRGARGDMTSVYFRDPDGNLVEVAVYPPAAGPD